MHVTFLFNSAIALVLLCHLSRFVVISLAGFSPRLCASIVLDGLGWEVEFAILWGVVENVSEGRGFGSWLDGFCHRNN